MDVLEERHQTEAFYDILDCLKVVVWEIECWEGTRSSARNSGVFKPCQRRGVDLMRWVAVMPQARVWLWTPIKPGPANAHLGHEAVHQIAMYGELCGVYLGRSSTQYQ